MAVKVSVIIPVYKVEKFIDKCASSLLEQTLDDVELIFVDDASPDGSMNLLKECVSRYPKREGQIKIIHHEKNQGLPAARNTGLAKAVGEYVFHSCESLRSVTIRSNVIGGTMFLNCTGLTSLTISNSLSSVGDSAFVGCTGLESVTIPGGVIGKFMFHNCTGLTSITFGNEVTSIGNQAFQNCYNVTEITFKGDKPTLGSYCLALGGTSSGHPAEATVYSTGWASDSVFGYNIKYSYTTFSYALLYPTVYVNVNGTWKEAIPYIKVNGVWKNATAVYVKANGAWNEVV